MNPLCLRAFVAAMIITKKIATKLHEETQREKVENLPICVICVICGFSFSYSQLLPFHPSPFEDLTDHRGNVFFYKGFHHKPIDSF